MIARFPHPKKVGKLVEIDLSKIDDPVLRDTYWALGRSYENARANCTQTAVDLAVDQLRSSLHLLLHHLHQVSLEQTSTDLAEALRRFNTSCETILMIGTDQSEGHWGSAA